VLCAALTGAVLLCLLPRLLLPCDRRLAVLLT
jgi:hypothetical protein